LQQFALIQQQQQYAAAAMPNDAMTGTINSDMLAFCACSS